MSADSPRTQQRLTALDVANERRLARAELRRRIARGEVFAARVLLDPPPEARTWEVGQVLSAQHRWGPKRARKLLVGEMIAETKPLGALTERQRRVLAEQLNGSPGGGG